MILQGPTARCAVACVFFLDGFFWRFWQEIFLFLFLSDFGGVPTESLFFVQDILVKAMIGGDSNPPARLHCLLTLKFRSPRTAHMMVRRFPA